MLSLKPQKLCIGWTYYTGLTHGHNFKMSVPSLLDGIRFCLSRERTRCTFQGRESGIVQGPVGQHASTGYHCAFIPSTLNRIKCHSSLNLPCWQKSVFMCGAQPLYALAVMKPTYTILNEYSNIHHHFENINLLCMGNTILDREKAEFDIHVEARICLPSFTSLCDLSDLCFDKWMHNALPGKRDSSLEGEL